MEISFQRAIRIKSDTDYPKTDLTPRVDWATEEVINNIDGTPSEIYDREGTSKKIGDFLRAQIGDYNKKTDFYLRRINGRIYLFTGQDSTFAKAVNHYAEKEMEELEEEYFDVLSEEPSVSDSRKEEFESKKQAALEKRNDVLLDMVENGKNGKPETNLIIKMNNNGMARKIIYETISKKDGKETKTENALII